jgi:hypothetical protein
MMPVPPAPAAPPPWVYGFQPPPEAQFPVGCAVEYFSASAGNQWIPAVVKGFEHGRYVLDIQPAADPSKVRAASKADTSIHPKSGAAPISKLMPSGKAAGTMHSSRRDGIVSLGEPAGGETFDPKIVEKGMAGKAPLDESGENALSENAVNLQNKLAQLRDSDRRVV